jgi:hypothetical protein
MYRDKILMQKVLTMQKAIIKYSTKYWKSYHSRSGVTKPYAQSRIVGTCYPRQSAAVFRLKRF